MAFFLSHILQCYQTKTKMSPKEIVEEFLKFFTCRPKSKLANSNGYDSENMCFDPKIVEAKMCLGSKSYFHKL